MLIIFLTVFNFLLFSLILYLRHYYWWLVLPNVLSSILILASILKKPKISPKLYIAIALFLGAFLLRMYQVEEITPGISGDEVMVGLQSLALVGQDQWLPFVGSYSHPTPLMYLTAASIKTFGHTMTAIRLPSIVFGSLVPVVFYFLLLLFVAPTIALLGGVLMVFSYPLLILSRLAYEPTASIFVQIVSMISFVRYFRSKDLRNLTMLALCLSAGLYTYLNFRIFAAVMIFLTSIYILKSKKHLATFFGVLFVGTMPLISFCLLDFKDFWQRSAEISIFSRNFPPGEFVKEFLGNIYRTLGFFFIGDPNPGKNPAGTPMFDPITIALFVLGEVFLFLKKRTLFLLSLLFILPAFLNDIFSIEAIPDFHYYGLGHPNLLRVSGLIPGVLFGAALALDHFKKYLRGITAVVVLCAFVNWILYFNQKQISPQNYLYNYFVNCAGVTSIISEINNNDTRTVALSKQFLNDIRVPFFLNPDIKILKWEEGNSKSLFVSEFKPEFLEEKKLLYKIIYDPNGQPDLIVFTR